MGAFGPFSISREWKLSEMAWQKNIVEGAVLSHSQGEIMWTNNFPKILIAVVLFVLVGCGGNAPFDTKGECVWYDSKGNQMLGIQIGTDHTDGTISDECAQVTANLDLAKNTLIANNVFADEDSFRQGISGSQIYLFDNFSELPTNVDTMSPYVAIDVDSKTIYLEQYMRGAVHGFVHVLEKNRRESDDRIMNHDDWSDSALGYAQADADYEKAVSIQQGIAY